MAQFRKVGWAEAATWPARQRPGHRVRWPSSAEIAAALARLDDSTGLTRLDRPGNAGGEHGWRARVYTRGVELHRNFSDAFHGGHAQALKAAVQWRNAMRQLAGPRPRPQPPARPRVARAEYARMCGWIAYRTWRCKRYFADGAHGGREAAEAAARAWLAGSMLATEDDR